MLKGEKVKMWIALKKLWKKAWFGNSLDEIEYFQLQYFQKLSTLIRNLF